MRAAGAAGTGCCVGHSEPVGVADTDSSRPVADPDGYTHTKPHHHHHAARDDTPAEPKSHPDPQPWELA
jgi:hypothetical protein